MKSWIRPNNSVVIEIRLSFLLNKEFTDSERAKWKFTSDRNIFYLDKHLPKRIEYSTIYLRSEYFTTCKLSQFEKHLKHRKNIKAKKMLILSFISFKISVIKIYQSKSILNLFRYSTFFKYII